ncbi:hypothetical protein LTR67_000946 [Exophiala xenobiotica]
MLIKGRLQVRCSTPSTTIDNAEIEEPGPVETETQESTDLAYQFGYSSVNGNHAFNALRKSLQPDRSTPLPSAPSNKALLHDFFKVRYCQLASQLPPRSVVSELIDVYFTHADWYFMALDRYCVEDQLTSWVSISDSVCEHQNLHRLSRALCYAPALLLQVLAVALQFLPPGTESASSLHLTDSTRVEKLSQSYSRSALEIMTLLGRHEPTVTSVEHDLMRLTWLKNRSRGSESWQFLSLAVRQAQLLGLHLEPNIEQHPDESVESVLSRIWDAEHKKRVWARIFILDAFMSLILGRPRQIHPDDCTVDTPLDRDFPQNPSRTVAYPTAKNIGPSPMTFVRFLCALAYKVHELQSLGRAGKRDLSQIQALYDDINKIVDALPPQLRPVTPDTSWDTRYTHFPKVRLQMISTANSFIMNLHRPYVGVHESSRQAATEAALKVLDSQQRMFELVSEYQYGIYGFSFYTIDAGILLSSLSIDHPASSKQMLDRILLALQQAISRLEVLSPRSAIARTGQIILRQCYPKIAAPLYQTADDSDAWPTNHPLPLTPLTATLPSGPAAISHQQFPVFTPQGAFEDPFEMRGQTQYPLSEYFETSIYNYLDSINGFSWSNGTTGGDSLQGNTSAELDGMHLFSYNFDENPYLLFSGELPDQEDLFHG